jgi:anthranilate phosphoribosyltransferase
VLQLQHGNRSISSKCGSADILKALGININTDPEIVKEAINEIGICFMFSPMYHGSMKYAAKERGDVKTRSIFNMLGPLTNPASASCHILGVYFSELTEMFTQTLKLIGIGRAFVVHGHDGMDEITTTTLIRVSELNNDTVKFYDLDPLEFFEEYAEPQDLIGGDVNENAAITRDILKGETGPKRDVVLMNSGVQPSLRIIAVAPKA